MEKNDFIPTAEILDKQITLAKLQQEQTPEVLQMKLIAAEQSAKFALTPVGQELKRFETLQRMGQMYAQATIVPDTYKNNVPNCAIALDMATRMNANPVMVMQNLYIVHGNPAWSSKFLIATINTCGRFEPLMYECNDKKGDEYGWRCFTYSTKDKEQKNRLEGTWITWKMVKAEGWEKKPGSKWSSMPEQMFKYRAAAFWQRMYAPEISMGFNTVEEEQERTVTDVTYTEVEPGGRKSLHQMAKERIMEAAREVEPSSPDGSHNETKTPDDKPASPEEASSPEGSHSETKAPDDKPAAPEDASEEAHSETKATTLDPDILEHRRQMNAFYDRASRRVNGGEDEKK